MIFLVTRYGASTDYIFRRQTFGGMRLVMAWMVRRTMEGERARVTASTDPLMSIAGLSTGPDMVRLREQGNRIWGRGGSW